MEKQKSFSVLIATLLVAVILISGCTSYTKYTPPSKVESTPSGGEIRSEIKTPEEKSPILECLGTFCGNTCYEEVGKCCDGLWGYDAQCCSDSDCSSSEKCVENSCKSIRQISVAILADKQTYSELSVEINKYKTDIINDLTTETQKVDVYIFYNWNSQEEIKNEIVNLWKTQNLAGVILVGNIPTYMYSSQYYPNGIPSDFYYMDVENTCEYPTPEKCTTQPRIWLGRITPPIKEDQGKELIRNYFDRNHNYRTGRLSFNREILLF